MSSLLRSLLRRLSAPAEAGVVRGTADRVIRVRQPVPGVFREAIFLLREDYLTDGGDEEALLDEARRAAAAYLRSLRD